MIKNGFATTFMMLVCPTLVMAQQPASKGSPAKSAPVAATDSGKELYVQYCAACHGVSGKGDGLIG